jgi:hypothetical protein
MAPYSSNYGLNSRGRLAGAHPRFLTTTVARTSQPERNHDPESLWSTTSAGNAADLEECSRSKDRFDPDESHRPEEIIRPNPAVAPDAGALVVIAATIGGIIKVSPGGSRYGNRP